MVTPVAMEPLLGYHPCSTGFLTSSRDPAGGQCQVGSLTGAVHLSNGTAGVLRRAQGGQKPPVEQKGKSSLDLDFQYEYRP